MEIVKYGAPVLRAKGAQIETITDEIRELADAMLETMRAANGVGLAAQQVGHALQMAIVDVSGVEDNPSTLKIGGKEVDIDEWCPIIFINPVLELGKEKEVDSEGCLSFPGLTGDVVRSAVVKGRARLIDGTDIEFEATGLLGRAFQHEVDHLNGILFIDRMSSASKASLAGKLKRLQKNLARR